MFIILYYMQLLFLSGITLVIGFRKTLHFFFQMRKIKGTICFLLGIVLVLCGWTFIGMIIEVFGFINLFGYPFLLIFLVTLLIINPQGLLPRSIASAEEGSYHWHIFMPSCSKPGN